MTARGFGGWGLALLLLASIPATQARPLPRRLLVPLEKEDAALATPLEMLVRQAQARLGELQCLLPGGRLLGLPSRPAAEMCLGPGALHVCMRASGRGVWSLSVGGGPPGPCERDEAPEEAF